MKARDLQKMKDLNISTHVQLLTLEGTRGLKYLFGAKLVLARTARYDIHMLKLWCHYASLDKIYSLNVRIVLASFYSKVVAIFCYSACTFMCGEICFQCYCSVRCSYVKTAVPLCFL